MSAFTAGPWKRGHMGDAETAWIGPDFDQPLVAKVDRNDRDEWEANARLIAAAPDLLAALIKVLGCFDIKDGLSVRDEMAIKHGAAIVAKAVAP